MKALRTAFMQLLLAALALTMGSQPARAFHDGGVAACDGCHSIHNYQGEGMIGTRGPYLLKGFDSSSVCLNCHEQRNDIGPTSYHISTPDLELASPNYPKQLSPAGDFGWLKKSYTWLTSLTQSASSPGSRHGHNINAYDYGYMAEQRNAPGGTYNGGAMTCISCHDPHGTYRRNLDGTVTRGGKAIKASGSYSTSPDPDGGGAVGVYRLLGGSGYYPHSVGAGYAFIANPPAAVAPPDYNRVETTAVTRVAYGSGMSEWCRNCHADIHKGTDSFTHQSPIELGAVYSANYNQYVNSGNVSGGTQATAYWSLVPFESGTANYATLKMVAALPTAGPDLAYGAPAVMCLSCHRAHASCWDASTRWNTKTVNAVYNGKYSQEGQQIQEFGQGRTEAEALQAYYQTPANKFNATEPSISFCLKCHNPIPTSGP